MSSGSAAEALQGYLLYCGADIFLPENTASGIAQNACCRAIAFPRLPFAHTQEWRAKKFVYENMLWQAVALTEDQCATLQAAGAAPSAAAALRMPVRQALLRVSEGDARLMLKGLALSTWSALARFCQACGAPLCEATGADAGGRICSACGRTYFPRISPAVIVRIRKENKILLAHNIKFPAHRFSLVAGFVEAGETLEDTVMREVREETGIEVKNIRYVRSQPWPFPDSLMLAFEADYASGDIRPDGEEISELHWYGIDELPDMPPSGSIARSLIDDFIRSFG